MDFIAKVEREIEQQAEQSSPQNSIGYEELPRTKVQVEIEKDSEEGIDRYSQCSWDDDTLSSNFCSDNEDTKRRNGTQR